jgi:phosphoglycolate phosphatase-like HAD superfamily hydrolase
MQFKAIILDFDGTIVESVGRKDQAFKELFKDYPQHINEIMDYHLSHNATIRYDKFEYITKNILGLKFSADINKSLSAKFSRYVLQRIIKCPLVYGAEEFLDYFYSKTELFLASVSPEEELNQIIKTRNLNKYFKKIYAYPWVKTEVIKDIIKNNSLKADEIVFIADSPEDYQAAQLADVFFVGRSGKKELNELDIPLFSNLKEIKDFLCRKQVFVN